MQSAFQKNTATRIMTQVMIQKKFLISEIPRNFLEHKCPMHRISIFINRGDWWGGIYTT
jgi:hypothetical protein